MTKKLHEIYNLYDSVEELDIKAIKAAIQAQFLLLMKEGNFDVVKKFVSEKLDWELFTLNTSPNTKLMESTSFLANIIRTHDIELIDYFINLSQYKYESTYLSVMSDNIAYGFEKAASGNNVKVLEYYDALHSKLKMNEFGPHAGLKGGKLGFDMNEKGGKYITLESVFIPSLNKAVSSEYPESDIIEFILSKKDKYGAPDCKLVLYDFMVQLWIEKPRYKKAEYIRKCLGFNYDNDLFKEIYNRGAKEENMLSIMNYLILEKNIPYNEEIKETIKDNPKIQKIFLYRKLHANLEDKNTTAKPKI